MDKTTGAGMEGHGERFIVIPPFNPQLSPPVLYALLPKLASRLLSLEEGALVFQVFIPRLPPPVLLPRRARFYAKLVNGYYHWRKVHWFSSFYSSTSRRRASPAHSVLYASLQCKLGSNSGRIAYFTQNWLIGYHHWRKIHWFFSFYSSTSGRRASPAYPVLYASLQCKLGSNSGGIAYFATKTGSGQQGALHIER